MPVTRIGPTCSRCKSRPQWQDGLCSPCWRLARAFGHGITPFITERVDPDSPEFEAELQEWLA